MSKMTAHLPGPTVLHAGHFWKTSPCCRSCSPFLLGRREPLSLNRPICLEMQWAKTAHGERMPMSILGLTCNMERLNPAYYVQFIISSFPFSSAFPSLFRWVACINMLTLGSGFYSEQLCFYNRTAGFTVSPSEVFLSCGQILLFSPCIKWCQFGQLKSCLFKNCLFCSLCILHLNAFFRLIFFSGSVYKPKETHSTSLSGHHLFIFPNLHLFAVNLDAPQTPAIFMLIFISLFIHPWTTIKLMCHCHVSSVPVLVA